MKSSGTIYWGGGGSGALAETDLSGNIQHEYVFFNGKRQARVDEATDTMHFYFADHLGSTSDVTDAVGNIQYESDYYPYGGEMPVITGDSNHYKFSGKERDTESGLDEFGARYYASSLGRFTIPDWAAKPTAVPYAHYGNPQSLNLYGYVENNPTTFGDPDGHEEPPPTGADYHRGNDIIVGAAKGLWNAFASLSNAVNDVFINGPAATITGHTALPDEPLAQYDNTTQAVAGTVAPVLASVAGASSEGGAAASATEAAESGTSSSTVSTVQTNKAVGDAFRDEVADALKTAGRDVKTEVTKQTPFGARRIDIEVSHNGETLGGVETKTGNSRYTPSQRAKDTYLKAQGYTVNVIRKGK